MNNLIPENTVAPVPWTPRDVAWGLLVFGLWLLLFLVVGLVRAIWPTPFDLGLVIVFGEAILLLPVWYFALHKYGATWADLGLRTFQSTSVGLGCGLMLLSLLFNLAYASFLSQYDLEIQPEMEQLFAGTAFPILLFFGGVIVAPFVEEVFFRGFVFTGLRRKWGWKVAALASAGLFALAHVIPTSILPIFILGLIFAFLYQTSGSIWPGILMHMLTNLVALTVAYAISQGVIPALGAFSLHPYSFVNLML